MMAFLRKYVLHNFFLKLFSLVVAVLLWMAVARDPIAEVAVSVPIEFQHVPENLEISSERLPDAQIWVRGPRHVVRNLSQSEVHAVLDISGAKAGERTYDLSGPQIRVPHEVEVVQVIPAQVHLTFDWSEWKEVPIRGRIAGLDSTSTPVSVRVDPGTAMIIGPRRRVQNVDFALTDAVEVGHLTGSQVYSGVHVFIPDPSIRVTRPLSVNVTVSPSDTTADRRKTQKSPTGKY